MAGRRRCWVRTSGSCVRPDRPAGRGRKLAESPIKRVARDAGIAIEQPATLQAATAPATLARYRPDVLVVVAYVRKRRRGKALMTEWEQEEEADPPLFGYEGDEEPPLWDDDEDPLWR